MTRELLRDHSSHLYASLAGWAYIPSGAEIAKWDQLELEGRLKRKGWRPWLEPKTDMARASTRHARPRSEREQARELLRDRFHIKDT